MAAVALTLTIMATAQNLPMAEVVCGPLVQNVTETGFTVTWITDIDAVAWVEVAPDDGTHFYARKREEFHDRRGYGVLPIGKIHHVEIDGLQPGTAYRYRLMSKGVISYDSHGGLGDVKYLRTRGSDVYKRKPFLVSTFKEEYDTLRFDIYNDIHGNDSLLNVLSSRRGDAPDFVLLNGDMTSHLTNHETIPEMYLKTLADNLKGNVPLIASRGNHECRGKDAIRWFDYFKTPTGAPYYSFSLGKFFFVVLDACEDKPDSDIEYCGLIRSESYMERQEKWLRQTLESDECKNAQVRIAICHIPPVYNGWRGQVRLCEKIVPHLNKAGLDVMFSGHIHKWRVAESDGVQSNAKFPIICNPNLQRMEVKVCAKFIEVKTYDSDGINTHSHVLSL